MTAEHSPNGSELDVCVTGGMVRGVHESSSRFWRGIPYAAPPVGERRFRSPSPVVPWEGIRDAATFGLAAPQMLPRRIRPASAPARNGEDCLTINVRTPLASPSSGALLPVMVFIHGGGYSMGSSSDFSGQGEGFVQSGRVVYVSFNYRLGALGYLDFSRYSSPERPFDSNLGLRDQIAALHWVQENIRRFGGDPRQVTVFGESAGGNAVTTLLAVPSARGLFARAIAQSAPPDAIYRSAVTAVWAAEFLTNLRRIMHQPEPIEGTDTNPGERARIQHLLSTAKTADLVAACVQLQVHTPDAYPGAFCLAPVVDGALLPEEPIVAIRGGRAHKVPLIIGTNDREGSIFRGKIDILPRSEARIRALFGPAPSDAQLQMRAAYPGLPGRRPAADFAGDYGFWYPSTQIADSHSKFAPVYVYRFDFAPRLLKLVGVDATHGVEMFALFDHVDAPLARTMTALGGGEPYARAGRRMREYWLQFAEGGALSESWPPYTEQSRKTLIIDEIDHVATDPRRERRLAWSSFLMKL